MNKLEQLNDVLQTRLRYVRNWNSVTVWLSSDTEFSIKWSGNLGDPDNDGAFHTVTYPMKMLSYVIREQGRKLKKDIPVSEQAVLKVVL